MTKRYIKFNELKQLINEDIQTSNENYVPIEELKKLISEAEKQAAWQGAILWALIPDESDSKRRIFEYYCATLNNSHERSTFGDLVPLLSTIVYSEITSTTGVLASTIRGPTNNTKPISDSYDYKGTYNLYYNNMSFEADSSIADTIIEKCKNAFTIFTRKEKVYVCYELNKKNTNIDVVNQATAKKAAFAGVKRIVESPESFTGYQSIKELLRKSAEMSTIDFLKKYGSKGIIGALLLKGGINLINMVMNRKKNAASSGTPSGTPPAGTPPTGTPPSGTSSSSTPTPTWKTSSDLKDMTLRPSEHIEIELNDCIENFDPSLNILCMVEPTHENCKIEANNKFVYTASNKNRTTDTLKFTMNGDGFGPVEKTITIRTS